MTATAESQQPNLLPAALAYVNRLGWPVFPVHGVINGRCTCGKPDCSRPGKHPIGSLAPRGLLDASSDPERVGDWWRSAPYANIGVPTGAVSGLAVLDVDLHKGGFDGFHDLQQRYGALPETVMAITGSGGYHYLFAHPGAGIKIKNSVRELGEGLDVRGDGGYIIVAPSSHISGRRYEWEASCRPSDMPLAPLPDWLLTLLADSPRPATPPPDAASLSYFQRVNAAAMGRLAAWVPNLFPAATPYHDGYRVTSKALGRDLQEDLSIVPAGIVDFGLSDQQDPNQGRRTPIALVMEHRGDSATDAAKWLCDRLGVAPVEYGWKGRRPSAATPPPDDPPPPPDDPPPGGPDDPIGDWEALLYRNNRGEPITSPANIETVLENHPAWAGTLVYDDMSYRTLKRKPPPYQGGATGEWSDADDTWTAIWLERGWQMRPKSSVVAQVIAATAQRRRFHQVRDWLGTLSWDGIERLPTFFSDFCGAKQTAYSDAVGRSFFVSAVARAMQPGCKVDTMLVLEGCQGIGKSRLILALFGSAWHIEISYPPGTLDFYQSLRGAWCGEFGEMAAFDRAGIDRIKQVLTQTQDTYRASYGHHSGTYPRQTIFVGSTNRREWGQDETGMRRFLPVECRAIAVEAVTEIREQLWAEALKRYEEREPWWSIPDAEREQEARFDYDAWEELIAGWIERRCKLNPAAEFSVNDVYQGAIYGDGARNMPPISRGDQIRIGRVMTRLGWQRKRAAAGKRNYSYERATP